MFCSTDDEVVLITLEFVSTKGLLLVVVDVLVIEVGTFVVVGT